MFFYTTFHQYVSNTCLDVTSTLGDSVYNPTGCGSTVGCNSFARAVAPVLAPEKAVIATTVSVYPNPAVGNVTVQLQQAVRGAVKLELWNSNGKLTWRQDMSVLEAGSHRVTLNGLDIRSGTYLLRVIRIGRKEETVKVVFVK